jgi:16S rRNA G1207 methylase RsmC
MNDSYYKKTIPFKQDNIQLEFDLAETLFSTFQIDYGSAVLIRNVDFKDPKTILDIGCGYGTLGVYLAAKYSSAEITAVDRDLLAVKYSNLNAAKNKLKNYKALGSLGVEEVKDQKFDLIVSNVPAKIGEDAIEEEFMVRPMQLLNPGGEYWIVIMTALNRFIPKFAAKHDLKLKEMKRRNGHIVYRLRN